MNFNFFKNNKDKILNEDIIFNHVKKVPFSLAFDYPNSHDDRLNAICSDVTSGIAANCRDIHEFQKVAMTLEAKRSRAKDIDDYRINMYKNILYPLFNYTNFLNSFDLLLNKEYNIYNINTQKLWYSVTDKNKSLITTDFGNVIKEKSVNELLQKYKLKTIDDLEYDYIIAIIMSESIHACLLYTSDAADDLLCVDLCGRRIIKKKKITKLRE
ncbi:hypothetical protein BN3590_00669 [Clostridium sp. C105KSO15]|nr:hypothetical protein BN3590_00669 [Clostridium sp. C105KSO15]